MENLSEGHGEDGLFVGCRLRCDGASMQPHDLFGETEPDPGSVLLGGKERDKDFINHIAQDSLAIIDYLNGGPSPFVVEAPIGYAILILFGVSLNVELKYEI